MSYDGKRLSKEDRKEHKKFKRARSMSHSIDADYYTPMYAGTQEARTGRKRRENSNAQSEPELLARHG